MDWLALVESQPVLALVPAVLRKEAQYRKMAMGETLFRLGTGRETSYTSLLEK